MKILFLLTLAIVSKTSYAVYCEIIPGQRLFHWVRGIIFDLKFDDYRNEHVCDMKVTLFLKGDETRLEKLPMKSLKSFALVNSGIKEIADDAFENVADSLEELNLSNNNLTKIPDLSKLPKLRELKLNYNQISNISYDTFRQMGDGTTPFSIEHLEFVGNGITELKNSTLSRFKNLKVFKLNGNTNRHVWRGKLFEQDVEFTSVESGIFFDLLDSVVNEALPPLKPSAFPSLESLLKSNFPQPGS